MRPNEESEEEETLVQALDEPAAEDPGNDTTEPPDTTTNPNTTDADTDAETGGGGGGGGGPPTTGPSSDVDISDVGNFEVDVFDMIAKCYNNRYYWEIFKSIVMFTLAIKLAQECKNLAIPMLEYQPFGLPSGAMSSCPCPW